MKIYTMNETVTLPSYANKNSVFFDIKSFFKQGDRIKCYNNWNKAQEQAVKGVGQVRDAFQLPPDMRALIPTGLRIKAPVGHVVSLHINPDAALKLGLELAGSVQFIESDEEEIQIVLVNRTDSLVVIENNQTLVRGLVEKVGIVKQKLIEKNSD
jgi:dUTPase